jgi:hypothetical protein
MTTTNVQLRVVIDQVGGLSVTVDHIRGTAAELAASNPTLGFGVFGYETDTERGKFGDGVTAYNSLTYFAGSASWASLSGKPATFAPSSHAASHGSAGSDPVSVAISQVTGLQVALDGKQSAGSYVLTTDSRLTDAREWSAPTVTQATAEAGVDTARVAWTTVRVWQAIAAWWAASSAKTKLDGIANGATANETDGYLLSRANHTGTQVASTISDFSTAAVSAVTWTTLTGKPSFAAVATSGAYSDLTGTPSAYTLPTASASVLGGVKIGSGISIDVNGVISASGGYTLPIASASTLGGIKIGSGMTIDANGVVNITGGGGGSTTITSGTALPTGGSDGDVYIQYPG